VNSVVEWKSVLYRLILFDELALYMLIDQDLDLLAFGQCDDLLRRLLKPVKGMQWEATLRDLKLPELVTKIQQRNVIAYHFLS
jgi:hypothetical protein